MSESSLWGLIGYGNIGKEVARQLGQPAVAERLGLSQLPEFVVRASGIMAPDGKTKLGTDYFEDLDLPPVTFVALPSSGDGQLAMSYYRPILGSGKMAITAEKSGIANFRGELQELSDNFARFGDDATVGGGAHILPTSTEHCRDPGNIGEIHLAANGTMTKLFEALDPIDSQLGMSLDDAVIDAKLKGFAEPDAESAYDVIRSETEGDIPKKTAILFNALGLSEVLLDWRELKFTLSDEEISTAVEEAKVRRFIVSIYPEVFAGKHFEDPGYDKIGGFSVKHNGWHIMAGFQRIDNPESLFSGFRRIPSKTGAGNHIVISLGPDAKDGIYYLGGDGAGPGPTVNAMLDNYLKLRGPVKPQTQKQLRPLADTRPPLPKELKYIAIDISKDVGDKPLTKDGHVGWELHQAGLRCVYGALQMHVTGSNPMEEFLHSTDLRNALGEYQTRGIPVFLGPAASLINDKLTITSSDSKSTSLGLWIPRPGQEINLATIKHKRLIGHEMVRRPAMKPVRANVVEKSKLPRLRQWLRGGRRRGRVGR